MPPLIPVGEPLGKSPYSNLDEFSDSMAMEEAMKSKQKGNEAFNAKDWISALMHYSRAIKLNPTLVLLFNSFFFYII